MQVHNYYLTAAESRPDWILGKIPNLKRKENIFDYPILPPGDVIVIKDTFDIFGFHLKSDTPDEPLNIIFYNNNGKIIIRYCGGKGRITKLDNGEKISLPMSSSEA